MTTVLIIVHHRFSLWTPPSWFVERLRSDFPQITFEHFKDYDAAVPHVPEADVLMTWSLRPEQFAAARKVRWIHSPAAAVHALMIPEIIASDVTITNASSVHGAVVAEHAWAMLMAMARRIPSSVRHQEEHHWAQDDLWNVERPQPRELSGATLALVGVGAIGGGVARYALAFDMRMLAVREHPERGLDFIGGATSSTAGAHSDANHQVLGFEQIDEVIQQADFLVLAAPLTPKTRGIINSERLARMKPDACLVNVSRGPLVDEDALIDALRERRIGGAALDVFDQEPLPPESPLWDTPNVLITPHSAGFTDRVWERHYDLFADNLRRFLAGERLRSVVSKDKGY